MAAGLGFKTFNTGDVLSAADVNGYLMQGVLVFADATARDAAITSPQEGQFAYTKNNDSLWYYSGSAWVASGATGDIEGVTAGTGISGGGTSGTVTITNDMATTITASGDIVVGTGSGTYDNLPIGTTGQILTADTTVSPYKVKWADAAAGGGLTLLSTTTASGSSFTISSINSGYTNLMIIGKGFYCSADADFYFRLNGDTGNNYTGQTNFAAGVTGQNPYTRGAIGSSSVLFAGAGTTNDFDNDGYFLINIYRYADTEYKFINAYGSGTTSSKFFANTVAAYNSTTAISSITINTGGSTTFSGGTVYIYGVK